MLGMGLPASCGGWKSSPGVLGNQEESRSGRACAERRVRHHVVQSKCAWFAQVHQVLSPVTRYFSPFFTARHLIPAESLPVGLGERGRGQQLSGAEAGQEFLLLLFRPFDCTRTR